MYRLCRELKACDELTALSLLAAYGYSTLPVQDYEIMYLDRGLGKYKAQVRRHRHPAGLLCYDVTIFVMRLVLEDEMEGWEQLSLG